MVELARQQWPDLTIGEFAAGLEAAREAAAEVRQMQRAAKALGERWR